MTQSSSNQALQPTPHGRRGSSVAALACARAAWLSLGSVGSNLMKAFSTLFFILLVLPCVMLGQAARLGEMPVLGDRLPEMERRLKAVEDRLAKLEGPKAGTVNALDAALAESRTVSIQMGNLLLKGGSVAAAAECYRRALHNPLSRTPLTHEAVSGSVVVCDLLINAAEAAKKAGDPKLAKEIYQETLSTLRNFQKSARDWNPEILSAKIKGVEKLIAELE